jgi:hypothetical protein
MTAQFQNYQNNAANRKIAKYNKACVENGLNFMPFAVDVCGSLQSDASGFVVQRLADSIASRTGSALSLSVSFVRQRLSCALFRAVAYAACTSFGRTCSPYFV